MPTEKPILLDLFCCQGGASAGYVAAGFDVIGVDIRPQPKYPYAFVQADALEYVQQNGAVFDAIHASPPCQGYTMLKNQHGNEHPLLIEPVRRLLQELGLPYVIENVTGAPMHDPVVLCGEMFSLGVIRHRQFETNFGLSQPAHIKHRGRVRGYRHGKYYDGPYVAVYGQGGGKANHAEASEAMGIDWMDMDGLRESIPPAYTEFIGKQLMDYLKTKEETWAC